MLAAHQFHRDPLQQSWKAFPTASTTRSRFSQTFRRQAIHSRVTHATPAWVLLSPPLLNYRHHGCLTRHLFDSSFRLYCFLGQAMC